MQQNKKCRLCRREGQKLFLKGERCNSTKCAFTRRSYAPGSDAKSIYKKTSDYAKQLRAKQACKRMYGISEKVLKKYYSEAAKSKKSTAEKLLTILETRLDNTVYRLGFTPSRASAKQLISHKHIQLNNKTVNIPSVHIKLNDKISVDSKYKALIDNKIKSDDLPIWLKISKDKTSGEIVKLPTKDNINTILDIQLIIEFYSR